MTCGRHFRHQEWHAFAGSHQINGSILNGASNGTLCR
jgi:hypothetical protein